MPEQASVAYLMSRFPKISETFILREILEARRQGTAIQVFPLRQEDVEVQHREIEEVKPWVHFTRFISLAILSENLTSFLKGPGRYLDLLLQVIFYNRRSANLLVGGLAIFPKSVYLASLLSQAGISHIHAHYATHPTLCAWIISRMTGLSYSFTAHAHDIFVHHAMLDEKIRRANFVVVISDFNRDYLLKHFAPDCEEKIKTIHCGIDPDLYQQETGRDSEGTLEILNVGSLQEYKGTRYLIEACHLLKKSGQSFRCRIVGDGEEREKVEEMIERYNLQGEIDLLGWRPQHQVTELLKQSSLFVLPSVVAEDGQMEGIPVALMEAMAAGLPVVASNLSGIPELVEDERNGLLVSPEDPEALQQAILRLAENDSWRIKLGQSGRERVRRHFNLRTNVRELRQLFPIHPLRSDLKREIAERAASLSGHEASSYRLEATPLPPGHDSKIYRIRASTPTDSFPLILKFYRPSVGDPCESAEKGRFLARREYEALETLHGKFLQHSSTLKVPRVLQLFPEEGALLMQEVQGRRLDSLLRPDRNGFRDFRREAKAACRRAAAWLDLFQEIVSPDESAEHVMERLEKEFLEDTARCVRLGVREDLMEGIRASVLERLKSLSSDPDRVTWRHGDFGPHNIFLAHERELAVIDFEGWKPALRGEDVGYFLACIDLVPAYRLPSRFKRELRAAFLDGFSRDHLPGERELVFFEVVAMIRLASHNPSLRSPSYGLAGRLKRRIRLSSLHHWLRNRRARL